MLLPKWPIWAHLFYSVFYRFSELRRACFRQARVAQDVLPPGVLFCRNLCTSSLCPQVPLLPAPTFVVFQIISSLFSSIFLLDVVLPTFRRSRNLCIFVLHDLPCGYDFGELGCKTADELMCLSECITASQSQSLSGFSGEVARSFHSWNQEPLNWPFLLMCCFPMDFKSENSPLRHSGNRLIKDGKRLIKEAHSA